MTEDVIQWLNPKIDFVFKSLFCHPGNHQALTVFVNALLEAKGLPPLTTLRIVNPAMDRKQIEDKSIVLDLLGVTETGEPVDLEMMSVYFRSTPDRALYYMSRLFSEQMQRGQKYTELKRAIAIFLLDFTYSKNTDYHSLYMALEVDTHEPLSDKMAIHMLELPKLKFVPNEEDDMLMIAHRLTRAEKWLLFFKGVPVAVWPLLAQDEPELGKVMKTLADMSRDPEMQELARVRDRGLSDYNSAIGDSYDEGLERGREEGREEGLEQGIERGRKEGRKEGREEGRQEGRQEGLEQGSKQTLERIALTMIAKGNADTEISNLVGLDFEHIRKLRERH